MKLACLCPTYRRPRCLANVLACYLAQDHPADQRELIIVDDGGQFETQSGYGWRLIATSPRFDSLPAKFNHLLSLAADADAVVVWEDDDVYLPWHLSAHAAALQHGSWSKPSKVWSNYGTAGTAINQEPAGGRFHGSLAMRRELIERAGGWVQTAELTFDQQLMGRLGDLAGPPVDTIDHGRVSYVYRWGNPYYHGSAFGDGWYDTCGAAGDGRFVGTLKPEMDAETERIYRELRA